MKKCLKKGFIFVIACLSVGVVLLWPTKPSLTTLNELEFYKNLLVAYNERNQILIQDLVPVEWDYMKVFCAYATGEDKVKFAGYRYAEDLKDINYEDVVSLLFMRDGKVVYYVDSLIPRAFDYHVVNDSQTIMTRKPLKQYNFTTIPSDLLPTFKGWAYYPKIEEATIEEQPYFQISDFNEENISLVLDCYK